MGTLTGHNVHGDLTVFNKITKKAVAHFLAYISKTVYFPPLGSSICYGLIYGNYL